MFFKRSTVQQIDAPTLKEWMDNGKDMILLDVRTAEEWKETGVVPGSLMVTNFKLIQEMQQGLDLNKDKPVVVICRSGSRSQQVAEYLEKQGIEAVNLNGGIIGWYRNQFQVERI
ncbi:MAG: rhodanese-like domain-containing protein [Candidatus Kariarchaeaceae archaeon]|jgi:rhodanese-related sulfurtransferase